MVRATFDVEVNIKQLEAVAAREGIYDTSNFTKEEKIQILFNEAERIGCQRMTIIDTNGDSFNGNGREQNVGDREISATGLTLPKLWRGKATSQILPLENQQVIY